MAKKLTYWILAGLVLGIFVGWGINAAAEPIRAGLLRFGVIEPATDTPHVLAGIAHYLSALTTIFLHLIKMIIAPLVLSTLVVGIAHMGDTGALGRVGLKALGWFVCASLMSLTLGLVLVHILQPGVGLGLPIPPTTADAGIAKTGFDAADLIKHIVPQSIFEVMATNEILPIVIFSVFFGVAITAVGERAKPLVRAAEAGVAVMLQITDYVMRL